MKTIIIREIGGGDSTLIVDVLQDGYNIIEKTVYGVHDLAKALLDYIEEDSNAD